MLFRSSFNTSIGLGSSSESTLTVDLIEDCAAGDIFTPAAGKKEVGDSIFFNCGTFTFGGVLTSWTKNQSQSGKTYTARASDPRQLLDNFILLLDEMYGADTPNGVKNVFNPFAYWDDDVAPGTDLGSRRGRNPVVVGFKDAVDFIKDPDINQFGKAQSSERGMKYRQIIDALEANQNNIIVYSNTGYAYTVDFSTFPDKVKVPDFYRIQGNTSLLQLLQNICEIQGLEFYVNLLPNNIISIGLIDLKINPTSFAGLLSAFDGCATDLSYGQELRQDKLKTKILGEWYHTCEEAADCYMYFGSELMVQKANQPAKLEHIVAFDKDNCENLLISKMITGLNASLHTPIPKLAGALDNDGPYTLNELDIRASMCSFQVWKDRVFDETIGGSFNRAVRGRFPGLCRPQGNAFNAVAGSVARAAPDAAQNPNGAAVETNKHNEDTQDLEKVYGWVKQIGDTYYGKQYLVNITSLVNYYLEDDNLVTKDNPELSRFMFTKVPSSAGGWTDIPGSVLGLSDTELQFFRGDDGRVNSFAKFKIEQVAETGVTS